MHPAFTDTAHREQYFEAYIVQQLAARDWKVGDTSGYDQNYALYAEDLVDFAASGGLCVDRTSSRLLAPPCDSCENYTAKPAARCLRHRATARRGHLHDRPYPDRSGYHPASRLGHF